MCKERPIWRKCCETWAPLGEIVECRPNPPPNCLSKDLSFRYGEVRVERLCPNCATSRRIAPKPAQPQRIEPPELKLEIPENPTYHIPGYTDPISSWHGRGRGHGARDGVKSPIRAPTESLSPFGTPERESLSPQPGVAYDDEAKPLPPGTVSRIGPQNNEEEKEDFMRRHKAAYKNLTPAKREADWQKMQDVSYWRNEHRVLEVKNVILLSREQATAEPRDP